MEAVAELIRDYISIGGIDQYCAETGVHKDDFIEIKPCDLEGMIFAIDGSNVPICDWSVASLNKICAGYTVYRGSDWQRTVITYDDVFLADGERYAEEFESFLKDFFGLRRFSLDKTELDRLSTYFRELQEYIALGDAIECADKGDIILYDGGFTWKERPLGEVLVETFKAAEKKGIDLIGVSKSSAISWGKGTSRPFVQHTSYVGSVVIPGLPWYLSLKNKNVNNLPNWDGETCIVRFNGNSELAFRADLPRYMTGRIRSALGKLVMHSCSAECPGYPHALFRAHRDIRIKDQEGRFLKLKLMDILSDMSFSESQIRVLMQDYHDVMEMRPSI